MVARTWMAALVAAGVMAGCSDTSFDSQASYDDLVDEFDDIAERGEDLDYTDPASLPTSGGATYEGVMGLDTYNSASDLEGVPEEILGEMTLNADFASSSVSGEVDDFVTPDDDRVDGSLDISNGVIDRTVDVDLFYTYGFDLNGTLTTEEGTDFDVDAEGAGDFFGSGHQQAGGIVEGVISSDSGTALVEGGFVAER